MKKKARKPWCLSFEVIEISQRMVKGVLVFDTKLMRYGASTNYFNLAECITIRGNPWPVGAKVDFKESGSECYVQWGLKP